MATSHLVQLFVKLIELGGFGHYVPVHEERCLDFFVSSFTEKVKSICDQRMVQVYSIVGEEISSMSRYLRAFLKITQYSILCKSKGS